MDKNLKQLFQDAREMRLSGDEKSLLQATLLNHVRKNKSQRQHVYRSNIQPFKLYKPMPIIIAILLALGGGTSFAAQNALPGDALYPIKIHVTEQVQGLATLSDESKANWEAMLANRRLQEAEELAAKSKLNAEARADLEANFETHANKAQERIQKLADVDAKAAADIAANFQTSLQAHDRIMSDIGTSTDGEAEAQLKVLSVKVKSETKDASEDRVKSETEVKAAPDVQAAAQGRLRAAQNKVAEVTKFIENKKDVLGADATLQAQAQLKLAADLIAQGNVQLNAKNYAGAFTIFGQAHAKAQQVKMLVDAKAHFEDEDDASISSSPSASPQTSVSSSPSPSVSGRVDIEIDHGRNQGSGKVEIDLD